MGLSKDARLGMISLLVVMVLGYGLSILTDVRRSKKLGTQVSYHIAFMRVEGLEEGSKVYYNGRLVGRVRKLELRNDMRAVVSIAITTLMSDSVVMTRESTVKVEGGTLWGERWISIQYEPGEVIPPGGEMVGESVASLNTRLYRATQLLDWLHETIAHYKEQIGSGDKAREKIKKMIKYWNYMAFDLRVQANKFNQFSGLINEQLDKMTGAVDQRIIGMRARSEMAMSQMSLYAHAMQVSAIRQNEAAHRMVMRMMTQMLAMRAAVGGLGVYINSGDQLVQGLLKTARERIQQAEDMVSALRFIAKNPKFADQFRLLAANMRKKASELKEMVEALRARVKPRTSQSPSAPATPAALPTGTEGGPPVPGVPMPPNPTPTPRSSAPSPPRTTPAAMPPSVTPPSSAPPGEGSPAPTPAPVPTGHNADQ